MKVPGVSCLRDKMDLLDYCKKVSPDGWMVFMVHESQQQSADKYSRRQWRCQWITFESEDEAFHDDGEAKKA